MSGRNDNTAAARKTPLFEDPFVKDWLSLRELADRYGMKLPTLRDRLTIQNMDLERALSVPVKNNNHDKWVFPYTTKGNTNKYGTFEYFVSHSWNRLNARTINGSYPSEHKRRYLDNKVSLDMSKQEFWKFCKENKQHILDLYARGDVPSIDRIDSSDGYRLENIQIISNRDNIRKQYWKIPIEYDGVIFCSMLATARSLGVGVGLVGTCLDRGKPYKGKYFKRLYEYTQRIPESFLTE